MSKSPAPLRKLVSLINDTYFVNDWISKYKFCEEDVDVNEQFRLFQADILNFSNVISEYFTISILNGNYLSYVHEKFDSKDNIFTKLLDTLTKKCEVIALPCDNEELVYRIQDFFIHNIIKPFNVIIEKYQRFISDLFLYYDDYESIKIFQATKKTTDLDRCDSIVLTYLKLFDIALSVAEKDHFLKFNNTSYSKLLLAREEMKTAGGNAEIKNVINQKINLLILKLLNRSTLVGQKGGVKYIYSFGLQNVSLELEEFNKIELYSAFFDRMNAHYELLPTSKKSQQKIYNNKIGRLNKLSDFHNAVKVYKDINESEDQVTNLYSEFKNFIDNIVVSRKQPFDKHGLNIDLNYFFNNYISIAVSTSRDFDFFKTLVKETEILQNKTLIKNYFSYFKICGSINTYLKKLIVNEDINIDSVKLIIEFQAKAIIELENNFHWSKERNLYAFQLTRDESYCSSPINYDGEEYSIFSANSFVLPLPYDEIKNSISTIKSDFNNLKNLHDFRLNTEKLNTKIKDGLDELKRSERKSTEILAIFSAISLFAIGDIHILTSEIKQDVLNPFRFILAFGFGLSLFVFLIWLITRDNIRKVTLIQWAGFAVFFGCSMIILQYFFETFSSK